MEFKHACSFCGWERHSATPVMLAPACKACGCALDARSADGPAVEVAVNALPVAWMNALQLLGVFVGVLALYAATKVGYGAGGASGAFIAFGMGCFLIVPFVPQRLR